MARFPNVYALDVMSDDHPGIVAAVSNAVESLGGNIDSCSQTVLGGYFTLIMIVSLPEPSLPEPNWPSGYAPPGRRAPISRCWCGRPCRGEASRPRPVRPVCDHGLRQGPAGHRPPLQPVPGRQGHQHHRPLRRPRGDDFVLIGQLEVPVAWDIRMLQADLEQMGMELGFTVQAPAREHLRGHQPIAVDPCPSNRFAPSPKTRAASPFREGHPMLRTDEILSTIQMLHAEHLDVRT